MKNKDKVCTITEEDLISLNFEFTQKQDKNGNNHHDRIMAYTGTTYIYHFNPPEKLMPPMQWCPYRLYINFATGKVAIKMPLSDGEFVFRGRVSNVEDLKIIVKAVISEYDFNKEEVWKRIK